MEKKIYRANVVTAVSDQEISVKERAYVVVDDGIIEDVYDVLPEEYMGMEVEDYGEGILIPAFSDLHIHASQYVERGIGMDCLLFDWLNNYTFPQEAKFRDISYAKTIYAQVIRELLRHGTMHANFFTTIHYDACDLFYKILKEAGMYAYTGKVNMDMNSPEFLVETTDDSLRDTERFLREHQDSDKVKALVIPRFAPTCSEELLKGLGKLTQKYHCGLHTHLVESKAESAWTKSLFPDYQTDGDIYERLGFLDNGPIFFAHVIFPEERDYEILKKHQCYSVHCPDATSNIIAGIMPLRGITDRGIPVALGTDIGGGHYPAVYKQTARAVQISKMKEFYEEDYKHIDFIKAFYHATNEGGRPFGKVGQIQKGYHFNALVIDDIEDIGYTHTVLEKLERFCYIGDDRNIKERFLDGKKIDPEAVYQNILRRF